MASTEVNGYKARGALQTAGLLLGVAAATVGVIAFLMDRVFFPNWLVQASDRFEQRIERHNERQHERGINRQLNDVKYQQQRMLDRMNTLVTKDDLDRFLNQLNKSLYGDSGGR